MRKLKLSLDSLQVESFHANESDSLRGTVPGHSGATQHADESCFGTCVSFCTRDGSCDTCAGSCNGTCYNTCGATCYATCNCPPGTGATECGCATFETCPGAPICS